MGEVFDDYENSKNIELINAKVVNFYLSIEILHASLISFFEASRF